MYTLLPGNISTIVMLFMVILAGLSIAADAKISPESYPESTCVNITGISYHSEYAKRFFCDISFVGTCYGTYTVWILENKATEECKINNPVLLEGYCRVPTSYFTNEQKRTFVVTVKTNDSYTLKSQPFVWWVDFTEIYGPVQDVSVIDRQQSSVTLKWRNVVQESQAYRPWIFQTRLCPLDYLGSCGRYDMSGKVFDPAPEHIITGLSRYTRYNATVRYKLSGVLYEWSDWSDPIVFTTRSEVPTQVEIDSCEQIGDRISIHWTVPNDYSIPVREILNISIAVGPGIRKKSRHVFPYHQNSTIYSVGYGLWKSGEKVHASLAVSTAEGWSPQVVSCSVTWNEQSEVSFWRDSDNIVLMAFIPLMILVLIVTAVVYFKVPCFRVWPLKLCGDKDDDGEFVTRRVVNENVNVNLFTRSNSFCYDSPVFAEEPVEQLSRSLNNAEHGSDASGDMSTNIMLSDHSKSYVSLSGMTEARL